MQSSNPVFARSETFNGRATRTAAGSRRPADWSIGMPGMSETPGLPGAPSPTHVGDDRITIDSVVQKTGATLGLLVASAAVTWLIIGEVAGTSADAAANLGQARALMIGGALIGFGLAMVNSFKRVVSPALVLAYAVVQGVAVGAISKVFETFYDGVVLGAVGGTMAAFAGTLTAYKVLDIKVTDKFRKGVVAAMFGFVAVAMFDFVLQMFGSGFGFNGFGPLGLITSVVGVVLGVLMLILDFDFVERAIAAGAPERESWRAAFGLTVTIVWIYIEMLRILAILRGD
ncbi:Bax inhibitor-1/YccA family protein [soil metagenome]